MIKKNKIIKIILIVFVSLIVLQSRIFADTPKPKGSYVKFVAESVVFVMSPDHVNDPVYNYNGDVFPSSGLYRNDLPLEPLWEVSFYCYESQVLFIEDIDYMIVKEGPYSSNQMNQIAFTIYRKGEKYASFKVSDFLKNQENFYLSSASHYSWGEKYKIVGNRLIVTTGEGKRYTVDVLTGKLIDSSGLNENSSLPENAENKCLPYLLLGGALLVIIITLFLVVIKKAKNNQQ